MHSVPGYAEKERMYCIPPVHHRGYITPFGLRIHNINGGTAFSSGQLYRRGPCFAASGQNVSASSILRRQVQKKGLMRVKHFSVCPATLCHPKRAQRLNTAGSASTSQDLSVSNQVFPFSGRIFLTAAQVQLD